MADTITNNRNMSEIKASLNHILHSLTELSAKINKPPHTPSAQLISTPAPPSLPIPSNPTTPSPLVPSNPTLPSSYHVKCLTYSEMQHLRDHGLCLNCNDIDTPIHRCPVKRILLVLPDEDPNIEQHSMGKHAPTVPEQLTYTSDSKIRRLELLEPADLKAPLFQSAALNSSVASQMGISINQLEVEQYGHKLFVIMLLGILCAKPALKLNGCTEQQWTNAHKVFAEMNKSKCERKILIFDPGGDIFNAKSFFAIWSNHAGYLNSNGHGNKTFNKFDKCISDLEDKVDLEGVGNDTAISGAPTTTATNISYRGQDCATLSF